MDFSLYVTQKTLIMIVKVCLISILNEVRFQTKQINVFNSSIMSVFPNKSLIYIASKLGKKLPQLTQV